MNLEPDNPNQQGRDRISDISDKIFRIIFENASIGMALVSIDGQPLNN